MGGGVGIIDNEYVEFYELICIYVTACLAVYLNTLSIWFGPLCEQTEDFLRQFHDSFNTEATQ